MGGVSFSTLEPGLNVPLNGNRIKMAAVGLLITLSVYVLALLFFRCTTISTSCCQESYDAL